MKLFDSEIKIMELIWEKEPVSAKEVSLAAAEKIGWNKNTTYTVLKKLEAKGYIRREDPGFICTSVLKKSDLRQSETESLINKLFGGSRFALFSSLLEDEELSADELKRLREMIDKR